jgi:hypothetical protein
VSVVNALSIVFPLTVSAVLIIDWYPEVGLSLSLTVNAHTQWCVFHSAHLISGSIAITLADIAF